MPEPEDPQFVMPPKDAARQLGIAASTLRRLAPTYEAVHGPLPWEGDEAGGGRLWPAEAVTRVQEARALVEEGRAKSLERALRALAEGAPPPIGVLSRPGENGEVEALRGEVEMLRAEVQALLREAEMPELTPRAEELVQVLQRELTAARERAVEVIELRAKVEALERKVATPKALPPDTNAERTDQALEAELRESSAPPERPPTDIDNSTAAERPGDGPGAADGLLVRAARWVERRLRW